MRIHESGEMYLETIYLLYKKTGHVHSVDISEHMGYSKPSVSRAMGILKSGGYVVTNEFGHLQLTDTGRAVAEKIFESCGRKLYNNPEIAVYSNGTSSLVFISRKARRDASNMILHNFVS